MLARVGAMDALAEALEALGKGGNDGTNKKGMHLPEDAGGHAARLWKFLDEMSERDPEAYAEFLEKQAVNAGAVSRKRGRCCGYRNHRIINRKNEKKNARRPFIKERRPYVRSYRPTKRSLMDIALMVA